MKLRVVALSSLFLISQLFSSGLYGALALNLAQATDDLVKNKRTFRIKSLATGTYLRVKGTSIHADMYIKEHPATLFRLSMLTGYHISTPTLMGKMLKFVRRTEGGSNLQFIDFSKKQDSQWTFEGVDRTSCKIRNARSGLLLTVDPNLETNFITSLQRDNNTKNQLFSIEEVEAAAGGCKELSRQNIAGVPIKITVQNVPIASQKQPALYALSNNRLAYKYDWINNQWSAVKGRYTDIDADVNGQLCGVGTDRKVYHEAQAKGYYHIWKGFYHKDPAKFPATMDHAVAWNRDIIYSASFNKRLITRFVRWSPKSIIIEHAQRDKRGRLKRDRRKTVKTRKNIKLRHFWRRFDALSIGVVNDMTLGRDRTLYILRTDGSIWKVNTIALDKLPISRQHDFAPTEVYKAIPRNIRPTRRRQWPGANYRQVPSQIFAGNANVLFMLTEEGDLFVGTIVDNKLRWNYTGMQFRSADMTAAGERIWGIRGSRIYMCDYWGEKTLAAGLKVLEERNEKIKELAQLTEIDLLAEFKSEIRKPELSSARRFYLTSMMEKFGELSEAAKTREKLKIFKRILTREKIKSLLEEEVSAKELLKILESAVDMVTTEEHGTMLHTIMANSSNEISASLNLIKTIERLELPADLKISKDTLMKIQNRLDTLWNFDEKWPMDKPKPKPKVPVKPTPVKPKPGEPVTPTPKKLVVEKVPTINELVDDFGRRLEKAEIDLVYALDDKIEQDAWIKNMRTLTAEIGHPLFPCMLYPKKAKDAAEREKIKERLNTYRKTMRDMPIAKAETLGNTLYDLYSRFFELLKLAESPDYFSDEYFVDSDFARVNKAKIRNLIKQGKQKYVNIVRSVRSDTLNINRRPTHARKANPFIWEPKLKFVVENLQDKTSKKELSMLQRLHKRLAKYIKRRSFPETHKEQARMHLSVLAKALKSELTKLLEAAEKQSVREKVKTYLKAMAQDVKEIKEKETKILDEHLTPLINRILKDETLKKDVALVTSLETLLQKTNTILPNKAVITKALEDIASLKKEFAAEKRVADIFIAHDKAKEQISFTNKIKAYKEAMELIPADLSSDNKEKLFNDHIAVLIADSRMSDDIKTITEIYDFVTSWAKTLGVDALLTGEAVKGAMEELTAKAGHFRLEDYLQKAIDTKGFLKQVDQTEIVLKNVTEKITADMRTRIIDHIGIMAEDAKTAGTTTKNKIVGLIDKAKLKLAAGASQDFINSDLLMLDEYRNMLKPAPAKPKIDTTREKQLAKKRRRRRRRR